MDHQRIMSRLQTLQDSSIIGERRMRRRRCCTTSTSRKWRSGTAQSPNEYVFVYFSFESATPLTPTRFWQRLLHLLMDKISSPDLRIRIDFIRIHPEIEPLDIQDLFQDVTPASLAGRVPPG